MWNDFSESELKSRFGLQLKSQVNVVGRELPQPKAEFRNRRPVELSRGHWNPCPFYKIYGSGELRWSVVIMQPFKVSQSVLIDMVYG